MHDYARYTAGQVMLETAERMTPEEREPSVQQYLLLVGGLRTLVGSEHDPSLVLDAYLVRSLAVAGLGAELRRVRPLRRRRARTGRSTAPPVARCAPPTASRARPRRLPRPSSCSGRCSPATGPRPTRASSGTAARRRAWSSAYLSWQLERGLRSLPLVERH